MGDGSGVSSLPTCCALLELALFYWHQELFMNSEMECQGRRAEQHGRRWGAS